MDKQPHLKKKRLAHFLDILGAKNILIVFCLNFIFAILEFVFGLLFNSAAILSDAVHDTGDVVAIGLAGYFQKLSTHTEDEKFSFGYQRFSLLGAMITSLILISGSVLVLFETFSRLLHPEPVKASGMFFLAVFAICANIFGAYLLTRGRSRNESILTLHSLEDVLGWLAVLLVSIVLHFYPWYWLDPLLSLLIALFILSKAIPKFIGTLNILLESTPLDLNYATLYQELESLPEVSKVTQLSIWSIDGEENAALLHLTIPENQDFPATKSAVRQLFVTYKVCQCAIELDETSKEHDTHPKYQKLT